MPDQELPIFHARLGRSRHSDGRQLFRQFLPEGSPHCYLEYVPSVQPSYLGAFSACRLALLRMHDGQPLGKCNDKRHEKADGAEYNAVDEFLTGFNVFLGTHSQNPPVPHGVFTSVSLYGSVLLIFRKGFCPASKKKKISAFLAK